MIYIITGHLGSGKTLCAVTLAIEEYAYNGRKVASNMTLNLDKCMPRTSRWSAIKLPGVPSVEHLDQLGTGYDMSQPYDESKFGLILLDEAGTWLNSRDWNDKGRRGLFRWVTHARKLGWDVALIVQDYEALDAQIRRSVSEVVVLCRRLDRIKMPILPMTLPKKFMAIAKYGSPNGSLYKWWFSHGVSFPWYDTRESVLLANEIDTPNGPQDMRANFSMLSAWHLWGRYVPPRVTLKQWSTIAFSWLMLAVIGAPFALAIGKGPFHFARSSFKRWAEKRQVHARRLQSYAPAALSHVNA